MAQRVDVQTIAWYTATMKTNMKQLADAFSAGCGETIAIDQVSVELRVSPDIEPYIAATAVTRNGVVEVRCGSWYNDLDAIVEALCHSASIADFVDLD